MAIQVRLKPKFPAQVLGGTGISVAKANGVYTFSWDVSGLTEDLSIASGDRDNTFVAVWDSVALTYRIVSFDTLLSTISAGLDATLVAIGGLTGAADKGIYFTGTDTAALFDLSTFARTLLDDSSASNARTTLGLIIGTDVQAYDAELAALAGLTSAANKVPYFTGSGTAAVADFTAYGRSIVAVADEAAFKALVNLEIGTDVQAYDAELAALAGLTSAANKVPYFTGAGTAAVADFSAYGRSVVAVADEAAFKALVNLEAGTDFNAYNARLADIAGITYAQGDVFTYNGTNIIKLAAGTSGQFLKTQGVGANVVWANVPGGGDLLAANNLSDVASAATSFANIKQAASTSATGVVQLADAAAMEAKTSGRVVTADIIHRAPNATKVWIKCDAAGSIQASEGVASITDDATGLVTVTHTTAFSSANYTAIGTAFENSTADQIRGVGISAQAAGSFQGKCCNTVPAKTDPVNWYFACHGDI